MRSRSPASSPAARPNPSGPFACRSWSSNLHRGKRVTSGGAGRIGSNGFRDDPEGPYDSAGYRRQATGLPR